MTSSVDVNDALTTWHRASDARFADGCGELQKGSGHASPSPAEQLNIRSVLSLSTRAMPAHLAAVVYCGNAARAGGGAQRRYSWRALEYFLDHWRRTLTAVVFAGAEPLMQPALQDAALRVALRGYALGLYTSGEHPEQLKRVLSQLNWVSLGLPLVAGNGQQQYADMPERVWRSLDMLLESDTPFECRLHVRWGLICPQGILNLARALADRGVTHLKVYVSNATFLPQHLPRLVSAAEEAALLEELRGLFPVFERVERFSGMAQ